ncbi:MAG: MoxR family ATPase [Erysipelotrichaceae bacterium]
MEIENIINELKKVVYGKDEILRKIILCQLSSGHVLLEDIPGVGKTTIALAFSKIMDLDYQRMQFTSDVMPSDITGFKMYDKSRNEFVYQKGPILCNLFLADEINRTSPRTQSALLEVMEEHSITIDGVQKHLEEPFLVIATQNPYGSAGTNLLPQSQMDRFMICTSIGYPSPEAEAGILKNKSKGNALDTVNQIMSKQQLLQMREEVNNIHVDPAIHSYIISLVNETRNNEGVAIGCSPRASIAIMRLAKANAYLEKRDYVLPSDVKSVFVDACIHRLVLKVYDPSFVSKKRENILVEILNKIKEPNIKKPL